MPGASRSITSRVASGVTSLGASPVPPVVAISSQPASSAVFRSQLGDQLAIVGQDLADRDLAAGLGEQLGERGPPDSSSPSPSAFEVETVSTAAFTGCQSPLRPPDFSSSRTDAISTPRSIPLTMS